MGHLFSIGLFIHIIGITCISGGSIGGLILESHIWKQVRESPNNVHILGPLMSKYPIIIQAGTLLMFISGLIMLGALGWEVVSQWWFIVKMAIVVALVLNGTLVAKPNSARLRMLVPSLIKGENVAVQIGKVKRNMTLFHISELTMLLLVYLLAIFRF